MPAGDFISEGERLRNEAYADKVRRETEITMGIDTSLVQETDPNTVIMSDLEVSAQLCGILKDMQDLVNGDTEMNHVKADALLKRAIRILSPTIGNEIADAFNKVEKWYA